MRGWVLLADPSVTAPIERRARGSSGRQSDLLLARRLALLLAENDRLVLRLKL